MSLSETMSNGIRRKKINVKEVRSNALNFYDKDIVNSLASSIEVQGQLSSAIVYAEDGEDGKKYTLVDGETRYLAICKLYEEGKHDGSFEVIIRPKSETELETIDMLMDANLQRTKSKDDRLAEIEKANELYTVYKGKDLIPRGMKKRDWIGNKIGLSGRQVQNLLTDSNSVIVDENTGCATTVNEVTINDVAKAINRSRKIVQKAQTMLDELANEATYVTEETILNDIENMLNDLHERLEAQLC